MIKIQSPAKEVFAVLGLQEYIANEKYEMSKFCFVKKVDEGVLIFSNLTKELLLLDNDEYNLLIESNYSLPVEINKYLIKNWFLISKKFDEVVLCDQIRDFFRIFERYEGIKSFEILPTTGCNARCFYCFEAGTPIINMTEKTAKDIVEFIDKNKNGQKVHLSWFGGEPLCNTNVINIITNGLKEKSIDYRSTMTSNGYAFDEKLVRQAKEEWKLYTIQITLDGMSETYAKTKNYKNGDKNPFDKVINNIKLLCENKIMVRVRLNLGLHNYEELKNLIDFLYGKFAKYENFLVYVNALYENEGFEKSEYSSSNLLTLNDSLIKLTTYIETLGIGPKSSNISKIKTRSCMADRKDKVMILPDGNLGFCEHYISSDFFGTIYDDFKKPTWCNYKKPEEKCKSCVSYPFCIIIEKCSAATHECYDYERFLREKYIERGVNEVYLKYKKGLESLR